MLCKQPHLILWVKQKSYPYWPAKLLSIHDEKISVRYFGKEHGRADVRANDCCLFSEENPSKLPSKRGDIKLSEAQDVNINCFK